MNLKSYLKLIKIAFNLVKADEDYIYDPKHEKNPGGGYHKTDKGWSKKEQGDNQNKKKRQIKQEFSPEVKKLIELSKSEDKGHRQFVGCDPRTPQFVLRKLAEDEDDGVRANVGMNPNIPHDLAEKLSNDESNKAKSGLALNSHMFPDILMKLSNDKSIAIRSCVATNPNAYVQTLEKLSQDGNYGVKQSLAITPSTPLYILENMKNDKNNQNLPKMIHNGQDFIQFLDEKIKEHKSKFTSKEALNYEIMVKGSPSQKGAIAFSKDVNDEILDVLSRDETAFVRQHVAGREYLSDDLQKRLAKDGSKDVLRMLASNETINEDTMMKLSTCSNSGVRGALCDNHKTTPKSLNSIFEYEMSSKNPNGQILNAVLENTNLTPNLLEKYSKQNIPHPAAKYKIAVHPNTALQTLKYLQSVTPEDKTTLHKVLKERIESIEGKSNNDSSKKTELKPKVKDMVKNLDAKIKDKMLDDENCPPKILDLLADDDEVSELKIVEHPNTSLKTLEKIVGKTQVLGNKIKAILHPNMTVSTLYKYVNSDDPGAKLGVARNPKATSDMLSLLADNEYDSIREAVAKHPNANPMILDRLSHDKDVIAAKYALQNPNVSLDTLKKMSKSELDIHRQSVINNSKTPVDLLVQMSKTETNPYLKDNLKSKLAEKGYKETVKKPLPKFKFKGDDKTQAIIRSKFEKDQDKEETETIYGEMAKFSRDDVAPMGVYHGRTKEQLKQDFIKNMDPSNYASPESFRKAQERIRKLSANDFSRMLASIFTEDEEEETK